MKILIDFSTASQIDILFNCTIYECLIKPLENKKDIVFFVIVTPELASSLNSKKIKNCTFIPLDYKLYELLGFSNPEVFEFLYTQNNEERYFEKVKEIYKELTKDIIPDAIITFEFGNCILRDLYPNVLNLTFLGGAWKCFAPDYSIVLDPINSCSYSSLVKFRDAISKFNITKDQENKIVTLKTIFKNKIIKTNVAKKELLQYRKKYRHLILLPLTVQDYRVTNDCNFKSQLEYVEYVFNKVPKDIGVIVTGHHANIPELQTIAKENNDKYSNMIIIDEIRKYQQSSLFVLPYVDAMINVCSSLVLKALLCDVPIISLGKKYNLWCQDTDSLENIDAFLDADHSTKNNIMYWYMTRYDIPVRILTSQEFLYKYLNKKISNSVPVAFNYFDELVDMDTVIKYYSSQKFKKKFKKNFKKFIKKILVSIYSVKKEKNRKIIKLFGMKIKTRRKVDKS